MDQVVQTDAPGTQARCDPAKSFGPPTLVANVNSSLDEFNFSLTRDEKTAFMDRSTSAGTTLLATRRTSTTVPFGAPGTDLTSAINGVPGDPHVPSPVSDGLILYFHRQTANAIGIYAATRTDDGASFDAGVSVLVDGSSLSDALSPAISADGQTLYWSGFLGADYGKLYAATRANAATFVNKRAASTIAIGSRAVLSADELTLFYTPDGGIDVLMSTRASKADLFGTGVPVANVNSAASEFPVALTNDGCVLYISSQRAGGIGGYDIWEARRPR